VFHNRGVINCSWNVGIQDECYLSIQRGTLYRFALERVSRDGGE